MQYRGVVNGLPATMDVTSEGDTWRAEAQVAGERYLLEGRVEAGRLEGVVTEAATGQQAPLVASVSEGAVELLLPVQGRFEASDETPAGEPVEDAGVPGELDARLFGTWLWTDGSFTGDISITLQERLILQADGTYQYGDARAVGSGVGVGVDTGPGGVRETGRWRIEGATVLTAQGCQPFRPYARYSTDGQSLLLTFPDGSKRLWQRAGYA